MKWLTSNGNNLYVDWLAVFPFRVGEWLWAKVYEFWGGCCRAMGDFVSVRIDTFRQNLRNQKFYETRGYQRLGKINSRRQGEHPFYCYKKIIG